MIIGLLETSLIRDVDNLLETLIFDSLEMLINKDVDHGEALPQKERERDRERERERKGGRERETERDRDLRERERERHRHADTENHSETQRDTERHETERATKDKQSAQEVARPQRVIVQLEVLSLHLELLLRPERGLELLL